MLGSSGIGEITICMSAALKMHQCASSVILLVVLSWGRIGIGGARSLRADSRQEGEQADSWLCLHHSLAQLPCTPAQLLHFVHCPSVGSPGGGSMVLTARGIVGEVGSSVGPTSLPASKSENLPRTKSEAACIQQPDLSGTHISVPLPPFFWLVKLYQLIPGCRRSLVS